VVLKRTPSNPLSKKRAAMMMWNQRRFLWDAISL
jgi:hypothetical protein